MAEKQFKESRSCSQKGCVHGGLGPSLNKQKNHSFHESGMNGFSHLYIIKNLINDQFDEADKHINDIILSRRHRLTALWFP